jgi:hypothetical protein
MRWRTIADEEMRWRVGGRGATTALTTITKTTINKCAAPNADDDDGWQEVGRGGGGGRATVWRTTVAEETRWILVVEGLQWRYQQHTKKKSTNEWQQKRKTTPAGERWGVVVEAEEQLLHGGGGFMVRSLRLEIEDEQGKAGGQDRVFIIFLFLAG